jgi:hypothetical protein
MSYELRRLLDTLAYGVAHEGSAQRGLTAAARRTTRAALAYTKWHATLLRIEKQLALAPKGMSDRLLRIRIKRAFDEHIAELRAIKKESSSAQTKRAVRDAIRELEDQRSVWASTRVPRREAIAAAARRAAIPPKPKLTAWPDLKQVVIDLEPEAFARVDALFGANADAAWGQVAAMIAARPDPTTAKKFTQLVNKAQGRLTELAAYATPSVSEEFASAMARGRRAVETGAWVEVLDVREPMLLIRADGVPREILDGGVALVRRAPTETALGEVALTMRLQVKQEYAYAAEAIAEQIGYDPVRFARAMRGREVLLIGGKPYRVVPSTLAPRSVASRPLLLEAEQLSTLRPQTVIDTIIGTGAGEGGIDSATFRQLARAMVVAAGKVPAGK